VADALRVPGLLTDKLANQHLLSVLLRRKAEMFEVPVQFFPISPQQVRRTSPIEGIEAIAAVLRGRVRRFGGDVPSPTPEGVAAVRAESSGHVHTR
jgi:hypothetical protein